MSVGTVTSTLKSKYLMAFTLSLMILLADSSSPVLGSGKFISYSDPAEGQQLPGLSFPGQVIGARETSTGAVEMAQWVKSCTYVRT